MMPATNNRITLRNAVLLIVIMLFGLYLALGAIFSLSYIKDSPQDRNSIVVQFDSLFTFKTSHFFADSTLIGQSGEPIKEIQQLIEDVNKYKTSPDFMSAAKALRDQIDRALDNAHDSLSAHMNYLTLQFELISKQYEDYLGQLNNIYITGNSKFHIAASRLSSRLLNQYEQEWIGYATDYETHLATSLHHNISDLRRNSTTLLNIVKNAYQNVVILSVRISKNDTSFEVSRATIMNFSFLPVISSYSVNNIDSATLATLHQPVEGVLGEDWGVIFPKIIGFIAGSRNVDTLLVFGMLGFGLFGAGIAIFISGESLQNTNTGSYLLLIIVRGFSAAIVVYLAARGGIAVVNKGVSDPDPLVLFLFCFIGAVFSERIWAWAKSRISTSFAASTQGPDSQSDSQVNNTKSEKK